MSRTIIKGILIGAVTVLVAGLVGCDEDAMSAFDPSGMLKNDTLKWRFSLVRTIDDDGGITDDPPVKATSRREFLPYE